MTKCNYSYVWNYKYLLNKLSCFIQFWIKVETAVKNFFRTEKCFINGQVSWRKTFNDFKRLPFFDTFNISILVTHTKVKRLNTSRIKKSLNERQKEYFQSQAISCLFLLLFVLRVILVETRITSRADVLTKVLVFSDWTREALSVRVPYTRAIIVKYAYIFYWRAFRNI